MNPVFDAANTNNVDNLMNLYINEPGLFSGISANLIEKLIYDGAYISAKWIYETIVEVQYKNNSEKYNDIFRDICKSGNLMLAKSFHQIVSDIDVCFKQNVVFRTACINGHLELVEWLLSICPKINVRSHEDHAIRASCENGHLHVAKYLIEICPRINVGCKNNYAFKMACFGGWVDTVRWLIEYCKVEITQSELCDIFDQVITIHNKGKDQTDVILYIIELCRSDSVPSLLFTCLCDCRDFIPYIVYKFDIHDASSLNLGSYFASSLQFEIDTFWNNGAYTKSARK